MKQETGMVLCVQEWVFLQELHALHGEELLLRYSRFALGALVGCSLDDFILQAWIQCAEVV